ncbi:MAG: hypothetical protein ABI120_15980 [Gemmatimonadaceae bacterium]
MGRLGTPVEGTGECDADGDAGTGVDGGVGARVATAATAAAVVVRAVGVGVATDSAARPGESLVAAAAGGAKAAAATGTAGELSAGVANADCTTPAEALVTITGNVPPEIAMTAPHTEHRARTPLAGTLAGSTRNTERQSGHAIVIVRRSV